MPPSESLFRESALERLSSPEQLDSLLQITNPRGWIALVAVWLLLAAVIAWSILGEVERTEAGQGIILPAGGLQVVESDGAGSLREIHFAKGELVPTGAVVAEIDRRDLADELEEMQNRLEELKEQDGILTELDQFELTKLAELEENVRDTLDRKREYAENRAKRLADLAETVDDLIAEGTSSPIEADEVAEGREQALLDAADADLEVARTRTANEKIHLQRQREQRQRVLAIRDLEAQIATLERRIERETKVLCERGGRVIEVRVARFATVAVGDPIMVVQPEAAEELVTFLYVPAGSGKSIARGFEVQVSPEYVKREEWGSIRGTVEGVSVGPTTRDAMVSQLADPDLAAQFMEEIGSVMEIRVRLEPDARNPSGYAWTSASGPDVEITPGTLCTATVTVETRRPISLVIPYLRRARGAG
jgi:HlyD family secretion protein